MAAPRRGLLPSNDNFANRLALTGTSASAISENYWATKEEGEPLHGGVNSPTAKSLWWTWRAPYTGTAFISASGVASFTYLGSMDFSALAVYTGNDLSTLTQLASVEGYAYANQIISVSIPVVAGMDYQIAYDRPLAISNSRMVLGINQAPVITSDLTVQRPAGELLVYKIETQNGPMSFSATNLPAGLSIDSSTGVISGKVATPGTYRVNLFATNAGGTSTAVLNVLISKLLPPTITSPAQTSLTVGDEFHYTITGSNNPTSFSATGLPQGLKVDTISGEITGNPDMSYGQICSLTIFATNALGTSSAPLTLRVYEMTQRPCLTSPSMAVGTVGDPFHYTITARRYLTGSNSAILLAFGASSLPPGLNVNTMSGEIAGTPTAAGRWEVPISAANTVGTTTAKLTVDILPVTTKSSITSAASAMGFVGAPFSFQVTADQAPTRFGTNNLPLGLAINTVTGLIYGIPKEPSAVAVKLYADNVKGSGNGDGAFQILILSQATGMPIITSPVEAYGIPKQPFYYHVSTTDKVDLYRAADLPAGLTIHSVSGLISGTYPNTFNVYPVTLTVSNNYGSSSALILLSSGQIEPCQPNSAAVNAIVGQYMQYVLPQPASYVNGIVPGMVVNQAAISGTPTMPGNYLVKFGYNSPVEAVVNVLVTEVPTLLPVITSSSALTAYINEPFTYYIQASNSPTSYAATNLPVGWNIETLSGRITATPKQAGAYSIGLIATNTIGTSTATLSLWVKAIDSALPRMSNSAAAYGMVNKPFYFKLSTTTASRLSLASVALPAGLRLNSATNEITGTPTAVGSVTVPFRTEVNSSYYKPVTFHIFGEPPLPPTISCGLIARGTVGIPFRYDLGNIGNYSTDYSIYSYPSMPSDLKLDTNSGLISGTPTYPGIYNLSVTAKNSRGLACAYVCLIISSTEAPPVVSSSVMAEGVVGVPSTLYQTAITGIPTRFEAMWLPSGLQMNTVSGVISGAAQSVGDTIVQVLAYSNAGVANSKVLLRIAPVTHPPELTSAASNLTTEGQPYSFQLTSNQPNSTFSATLPPGLQLNTLTGLITGAPLVSGSGSVNVTTYCNNTYSSAYFSLVILPKYPTASAPIIAGPTSGTAFTNESWQGTFYTTTNVTSFTTGTLPAGLSFGVSDTVLMPTISTFLPVKMGRITGMPTTPGFYTIPITAVSPQGTTTSTLSLMVTTADLISPSATFSATNFNAVEGGLATLAATLRGIPAPECQWVFGDNAVVGATSSVLEIPTVTPADMGGYVLSVTNLCGTYSTGSASLTVLSTFNQWQARQFTPEQLADPDIAGPTATPHGDGVPNLLKYALNIDPTRPVSPEDASAFPASTVEPGATQYLSLVYRQNKAAIGVVYELQTSDNLIDWQTVTPDVSEIAGTDATTGDSIVRKKVDCTGQSRKFIRLRIVAP